MGFDGERAGEFDGIDEKMMCLLLRMEFAPLISIEIFLHIINRSVKYNICRQYATSLYFDYFYITTLFILQPIKNTPFIVPES
jgi:hypothetical protein